MNLDGFLDAYASMSHDDQTRFSAMIADKINGGAEDTDDDGNAIDGTLGWAEVAGALRDIMRDRK